MFGSYIIPASQPKVAMAPTVNSMKSVGKFLIKSALIAVITSVAAAVLTTLGFAMTGTLLLKPIIARFGLFALFGGLQLGFAHLFLNSIKEIARL